MKQKHFMDIIRIKMGDGEFTVKNIGGFLPGDHVLVQEKFDGSNASCAYDPEANTNVAFSRKQELSYNNTLNGFWNYVQQFDIKEFADTPNYRVFGEWATKNKIIYREDIKKKWYVFDIFDVDKNEYLPQDMVKSFCAQHNLNYIHTFYDGKFISWEHCMSFVGQSVYTEDGTGGEGVVVKNMTNLNNVRSRDPFVLKIVSDKFSEVMKHKVKIIDPAKLDAQNKARAIVESIVTKRRVEKELRKMIDEQVLPEKLTPENMGLVARELPRRIYNDCVKEENESVVACGEYFGKMCGSVSMQLARDLVCGVE